MKGYEIEVSKDEDEWVKLPIELTRNRESIELTIKALQIIRKIDQGKYVKNTKGIVNKIKHYFLGYMLITDHVVKTIS